MDDYLVYVKLTRGPDVYFSPLETDERVDGAMDDTELIEILDANMDNVCHRELNTTYIMKSYKKSDVALFLFNVGNEEQIQLEGFIFGREITDRDGHLAMDLDVVCAVNHGGSLLRKCVRFCQSLGTYRYIQLSALHKVIGFYRRFGFKHQAHCNPQYEPDAEVTPELAERLRRTDDPRDDLIVMNYLYSLHRFGYTPLSVEPAECHDPDMSRAAYGAQQCWSNGVEMRRCFVEDAGEYVRNRAEEKRREAIEKYTAQIQKGKKVIDVYTRKGLLDTPMGANVKRTILQRRQTLRRQKHQMKGVRENNNAE